MKIAIATSDLFVKEMSAKSGGPKKTIDKRAGSGETKPDTIDLHKVYVVFRNTMEEIAGSKAGAKINKVVRNDPGAIRVPARLSSIVEDLLLLDENELIELQAYVEAIVKLNREKYRNERPPWVIPFPVKK
jgi:hypothetical protein